MKRIWVAMSAAALTLTACGGTTGPTEPLETAVTATRTATVTEVVTVAPAASANVSASEEPALTPTERVFIVNARQEWPTASDGDAVLLGLADVACAQLAVDDFDGTASLVRDMMTGDPTLDQAINFTIISVMNICPEHDSKLPG